jgi:hypothetical protein
VGLALAGVGLLVVGGYFVTYLPAFTERGTKPFCHKALYLSFGMWMEDRKTNAFPNINGSSQLSLHAIVEELNTTKYEATYNCVPGLQEDDPKDLVLLYSKWKTRFIWHGDAPKLFRPKRWIVVPPDFYMTGRSRWNRGELSDWVPTAELRARLTRTLEFLKAQQRPNWEQVVKEHSAFLKTLSD